MKEATVFIFLFFWCGPLLVLETLWKRERMRKCCTYNVYLTLKEPGFLDPSHSRGGGGFRPPLRSRKPIDEISSVWYYWIAMTLPSPLVGKKVQTYLVWRHSDVMSDVMSKTWKSPKIAKIMVFRYFFAIFLKQSCIFWQWCVSKYAYTCSYSKKNKINKIKHSESVSWKQKKKTRFVCNFHWKSVFRWTQRSITQRRVITLGPIFFKWS